MDGIASKLKMTATNTESIIARLGGCGRFQKVLCVLSHVNKIPHAFTMYVTYVSIVVPEWRCADDDFSDVIKDSYLGNSSSVTFGPGESPATLQDANRTLYDAHKSCTNRNGSSCQRIVFDDNLHTIVSDVCIK